MLLHINMVYLLHFVLSISLAISKRKAQIVKLYWSLHKIMAISGMNHGNF